MFDRPLRADCGVLIRAVFVAQVCTGRPRAAIVVTVTGLVSVPPPPPFHLSVLSGGTQGAPVGVGVAMTLVADEQWGGGGGSSVSKKGL